jgi:acetyl esterase/lipase
MALSRRAASCGRLLGVVSATGFALAGCASGPVGWSPGQAKNAFAAVAASSNASSDPTVVRDQVYATRDTGPLALDLYLPQPSSQPHPFVVFAHGGGWESGDRSVDPAAVQEFVGRGYAVASVDYRLSDVAKFPAQPQDVRDAVVWLQQNSGRFGLDAQRVGLWGGSAGGHLANLLGASTGESGLGGVRAVASWAGPTDLTIAAGPQRGELNPIVVNAVDKMLGCVASAPECGDRVTQASPAHYVSGDEPAFLAVHGTADNIVPLQQSQAFAEALHRAGRIAEVRTYDGVGHDFNVPQHAEIVRTTVDFMDRNLRS